MKALKVRKANAMLHGFDSCMASGTPQRQSKCLPSPKLTLYTSRSEDERIPG